MKIYLLILTFIFIACSNNIEKPPDNILPELLFENILEEINLQESYFEINNSSIQKDSIAGLTNIYFDLQKKHKFSDDHFKKTLDYYSQHPYKLKKIYTRIINRLNKKKANFDQQ